MSMRPGRVGCRGGGCVTPQVQGCGPQRGCSQLSGGGVHARVRLLVTWVALEDKEGFEQEEREEGG